MSDRAFAVGSIKGPNRSQRSYTVLYKGKPIGVVSRKGLELLLEGEIHDVDIVVFKNFYLKQLETSQRTLNIKTADPNKLNYLQEAQP